MTICDICGREVPYQGRGKPRVRHEGACQREYRRRYQAVYVAATAPRRAVLRQEPVPGDVSAAQIEARYQAALRAVKGTFRLDPWARRGTP